MTCIAGIVENGSIWIGADSAGVSDCNLTIRADEKVFRNGDFLFGFTSSFRMGQLLRYKFTPPDIPAKMNTDKYMVTLFVDAVRQCLKDGGFQKTKDEVQTGGTFLVGFRGRLFGIEGDYQVASSVLDFDAVGCGHAYAKGVLYALRKTKLTPRDKIMQALKAAECFSPGVRGPFVILKL